jgi:XTP/dITP diphosphohydrolase
MKLIFATNNKHKLEEIQKSLNKNFEILSLSEIGFEGDIPETHETLEENSMEKAEHIYKKYNINVFADDTGLEIEALNGEPGVYSARYAGNDCNFRDNMLKVLKKLEGIDNRKANFRTIITLIIDNKKYQFEGIIKGEITKTENGNEGFGYDPIFRPDGFKETFAELGLDIKNEISHRGLAVKKLIDFLEKY